MFVNTMAATSHVPYRRRGSFPIALLLAILHLGASVAEPVLHAAAEVLDAEGAIEATHSERCAIVHVDVRCAPGNLHKIGGPGGRDLQITQQLVPATAPDGCSERAHSSFRLTANAIRGPPVS